MGHADPGHGAFSRDGEATTVLYVEFLGQARHLSRTLTFSFFC